MVIVSLSKPLGSPWFKLNYVKGECTFCGFHNIPLCDRKLNLTNTRLVFWQRFEKQFAGKTRDGELKEITCLEHKRINTRMFLAYAAPKICEFVLHNHVDQWKDK